MFDRFSFYRSKEWRNLLDVLKGERVNDNGQIICEYCGKPITKAYDMIGHHRVELTEENVNDFDVSLNPDNIAFVHHRCHNYIHNKLGYSAREVFIVYGAPLSGKMEWVQENMSEGDLIVDTDSIWQCVSGLDRYVHPKRLNQVMFSVRDCLLDAVRYRLGRWHNAYLVGGFPLVAERERLAREMGARIVYIDTPRAECLENLERLPKILWNDYSKYIDDWFEKASEAPPCC